MITLGYLKHNTFYPIISSRTVKTPRNRPSDYIDEHWMTIEELSTYSFRVEMDTMSLVKNIKSREMLEELKADSYSLVYKLD